jgi:hypothetical protein
MMKGVNSLLRSELTPFPFFHDVVVIPIPATRRDEESASHRQAGRHSDYCHSLFKHIRFCKNKKEQKDCSFCSFNSF